MITTLEEKLGYTFKNKDLLILALTHRSQKNRHQKESFERLEFLGDRVLGLAVAEKLYAAFPNEAEGTLAKRLASLVSKSSCGIVAKNLSLRNHIKAASHDLTNTSIMSDAVEAILGAIFIESGFEAARPIILTLWKDLFEKQSLTPPVDYKTTLQEWSQNKFGTVPIYTVISTTGPAHAPEFIVEVNVGNTYTAQGRGETKRLSEARAAEHIYHQYVLSKS